MLRLVIFCALTFAGPAFSNDQLKQEIIDLINSDLGFYTKVEPGMGFTGEMVSDLLNEEGNYLNCTIALRGKQILLNNTLDDYEYSYQEHWIDINIKEGNNCNPEMYPKEHRKFVAMGKKQNPLEVLDILQRQQNLTIEKVAPKTYILKYIIHDEQTNEDISINAKYDLNLPLYMNPESNGFRYQYFNTSMSLNSIALCSPIESGGECSEEQDLSYLLKR